DRSLLVFGGGGLSKSIIDVVRQRGKLEPLCVVDDGLEVGADVLGVPVVGGRATLGALHGHGLVRAVNAVGAIGDIGTRVAIFEALGEHGFELPVVVDVSASVAASAQLADGAQVFALAMVGSEAHIGRGAIVNSGAIVSHDCEIGAYTHVAPGALLAGEVRVGESVLVGMGVTARVGLRIGDGAIIGNGSTLRGDVESGTIVSAGSVWPRD
ncbi:MAG: acetyltransferase, partial [Gaiellales bacterium]